MDLTPIIDKIVKRLLDDKYEKKKAFEKIMGDVIDEDFGGWNATSIKVSLAKRLNPAALKTTSKEIQDIINDRYDKYIAIVTTKGIRTNNKKTMLRVFVRDIINDYSPNSLKEAKGARVETRKNNNNNNNDNNNINSNNNAAPRRPAPVVKPVSRSRSRSNSSNSNNSPSKRHTLRKGRRAAHKKEHFPNGRFGAAIKKTKNTDLILNAMKARLDTLQKELHGLSASNQKEAQPLINALTKKINSFYE